MTPKLTDELTRRRLSLCIFFFLPGIALASWVSRTPAIRDAIKVSLSEMGIVLFGLSVGSMTGILGAGYLLRRFGTRMVAFVGLLLTSAALFVMALGVAVGLASVVTFGLFIFGLSMGVSEIAINVEGTDFEAQSGRSIMPTLHGCFSLGTVVGALLGMVFAHIELPVAWHLALAGALVIPPVLLFIGNLQSGLGRTDASAAHAAHQGGVWRDRKLMLIGVIVLAMALAEGAANDWLTLLMVDEHGFDQAAGSFVFLAFAIAMTVGRFGGTPLLDRYGPAFMLRGAAISGAIGLALIIFVPNGYVAAVAVIFWGLGASLGFPVALSAAGSSGPNPAERVRIVATVGYVAFLVGPPLLGFLGEDFGLRKAMLVVLALLIVAATIAPALTPRPILSARRPESN